MCSLARARSSSVGPRTTSRAHSHMHASIYYSGARRQSVFLGQWHARARSASHNVCIYTLVVLQRPGAKSCITGIVTRDSCAGLSLARPLFLELGRRVGACVRGRGALGRGSLIRRKTSALTRARFDDNAQLRARIRPCARVMWRCLYYDGFGMISGRSSVCIGGRPESIRKTLVLF